MNQIRIPSLVPRDFQVEPLLTHRGLPLQSRSPRGGFRDRGPDLRDSRSFFLRPVQPSSRPGIHETMTAYGRAADAARFVAPATKR
jgi:hypothetical protein